jgi:hypothetical protein
VTSSGTRGITLLAALAAIAVGGGFLFGAPAEVAGATAIAFAAAVSLITVRNLALQAHPRARAHRPVAASPALEQLNQIDKSLSAALDSDIGVDHELRPLLRPIAAIRLARRGVDLDSHTVEARAILGEELWELVRPKGPPPSPRYAGGISTNELRSLIEQLERT